MAIPGSSGSGGGGNKSDAQKLKTASKQVSSGTSRLESAPRPQSRTLLDYANTGKQDYATQEKSSKANPLARVGSTILSALTRPSQAVLHGIQNRYEGPQGIVRGVGAGITGSSDGFRAVPENNINFRQAANAPVVLGQKGWKTATPAQKDAANKFVTTGDFGGVGGAVVDFGATTVLDPLTYLGGAGVIGRGGLKALSATGEEGAALAAKASTKGASAYTPIERARARELLESTPQAQRAGRRGANPTAYADKLIGKENTSRFTGGVGKISQPRGVRFAGKTVLPKTVTDAVARRTGLAAAGKAVSGNRVARGINDAFNTRAAIARDLGRNVADKVGFARAGAAGQSATLIDDISRSTERVNAEAQKAGVDVAKFQRDVVTPALESGRHAEVSQQLRTAGRNAEADLIDHADALRRQGTQTRLDSGVLKEHQVRDDNTRVPRVANKDFQKFLDDNATEAESMFQHQAAGVGVFSNAEAQFRTFMPDAPIAEVNAAIAERTGGRVLKAFDDNAVSAIAKDTIKANQQAAKANVLTQLTKEIDDAGSPLLVKIDDKEAAIKSIDADFKAQRKDLNKKIASAEKAVQRQSVKEAGRKSTYKAAEAGKTAAAKKVDSLQALVTKLKSRSIAAGARKRAAAEAGSVGKVSAARLPSASEIRKELNEVLADPTLPADVRTALRKEYAAAAKAGAWERSSIAAERAAKTAATGTRSIQQAVGATKSAAKYEGQFLKAAQSQLSAAEREFSRLSERASKVSAQADSLKSEVSRLKSERTALRTETLAHKKALRESVTQRPAGYVKVSAGPLGSFYGPRSIVEDLQKLDTRLGDKDEMNKLLEISGVATQALKNYTLNAAPFFVGRIARDGFGNVIAMWSKGFKDPRAFTEAVRVQKEIDAGLKKGLSHDEALDAANISPKLKEFERLAEERGAINSGQLRTDIDHVDDFAVPKGGLRGKVQGKLDPRKAEAFGTATGAKVNTFVDDVSRRAMFYDQMWQHGDPDLAARRTAEALFDYADLTSFEKKLRKVVWFYTFAKKNVALQSWVLTHAPAKSVAAQRLKEEIAASNQDTTDNAVLPEYSLDTGQIPLGKLGKTPLLGGIQTPFEAAAQQIQPLADAASFAGPEKYTTQGNIQGAAAGALGNIGGAPGNLAKQVFEEASGNDLYTGAPLKKGKKDVAQRLIESQVPRGAQSRGIAKDATSGTADERKARLLSLLGVTNTLVTDKRQTGEAYRRKRAVEDSAERQGIPTASKLKAGTAKKKGATTSTLTPKQLEAIKKLQKKN